jgi:hypothetical protein
MTTGFQLLINGVDRTPDSEWDATWEQRLDGVGHASITIQDRIIAEDYGRVRDLLVMRANGVNVFSGEITDSRNELPPGRPWPRWKITASDWNTVFDLRLVGAPDGSTWGSIDGGQTHGAIDPAAHSAYHDGWSIDNLFNGGGAESAPGYARLPDGTRFDTSQPNRTNYLPRSVFIDPATNEYRMHWTNTTLRSAVDEIRGLAPFPIYCWIDPDHKVHWQAFGRHNAVTGAPVRPFTSISPHAIRVPSAAAIVTDVSPNGTTSVGGRELSIGYDGAYMPEQPYITGTTDFIYRGGSVVFQGTGFPDRQTQDPTKRQLLVDAQAITEAQKDSVARHYMKFATRARVRGSIKVGTPDDVVDSWRVGQMLKVVDARLPASLNGRSWPIQRVAGELKAGNDFRVYTLEFGDAPIDRFFQKYRATPGLHHRARHLPARKHHIYMPTHHLRPSTTYTLQSQMVDEANRPVRQAGVPVVWSLEVRDRAGVNVGGGSITAITSATDKHGRTSATLVTSSSTDVHYHVTCKTRPVTA